MAEGITPDSGAPIDGVTAKRWMDNYKGRYPEPDTKFACFYGNKIINQILSQPDCIGIRTYYGIDDAGEEQFILVGVDSEGHDICDLQSTQPMQGGIIADNGPWCPPFCNQ